MTWVLYVLFMTDARTLQHIAEARHFHTEQGCYQHYERYKSSIDDGVNKIIQQSMEKYEILYVGCMKTTALMEIK